MNNKDSDHYSRYNFTTLSIQN